MLAFYPITVSCQISPSADIRCELRLNDIGLYPTEKVSDDCDEVNKKCPVRNTTVQLSTLHRPGSYNVRSYRQTWQTDRQRTAWCQEPITLRAVQSAKTVKLKFVFHSVGKKLHTVQLTLGYFFYLSDRSCIQRQHINVVNSFRKSVRLNSSR